MTSLRIAVVLLAASTMAQAALGISSTLTAQQEKVLESARQYALQYTAKLPDFICTQVTKRDSSRANTYQSQDSGIGGAFYGASDEIVEKLTYFNQKENYEVVAINKKKADGKQHSDLGGASSAGEFGSALLAIFNPKTHTEFSGHRMGDLRGHHVDIFTFRVPKEAGIPVSAPNLGKETLVAYHGLIFFDAAANEVLRVTTNFELPSGFPIQQAFRIVEYDTVTIAGHRYNLPAYAEVHMQSGPDSFVNKIEFKDYREFAVQSTIRFGVVDEPGETKPATSDNEVVPAGSMEVARSARASETTSQVAPQEAGTAHEAPAATATPVAAPVATESSAPTAQQNATAASETAVAANSAAAPQPPSAKLEPQPAQEVASHLRLNTDLVLIPVIVRDASGHVKTNLSKEDFQIFDKGKRQEITSFTVEQREGQTAMDSASGGTSAVAQKPSMSSRVTLNYIVYLFDDIHLNQEELVRTREAARQSVEALPTRDLAAIVTTSGLVQSTMSTDREKFKEALMKLQAHPLGETSAKSCPDFDAYIATQILGQQGGNPLLLKLASQEAAKCMKVPISESFAQQIVLGFARDAEIMGKQQTRQWLAQLKDVVLWVGKAPGRRSIILVSPGFVPINAAQMEGAEIIDEAIRSEVTISALDARGVYGENPAGAIEDKTGDPDFRRMKVQIMYAEATASADVLEEMTGGTGGSFVRNTNNLNAGLKSLATPPGCIYVLGFKPGKLKLDGSIHPLVVKVNTKEKLDIQARRGYVAAKR